VHDLAAFPKLVDQLLSMGNVEFSEIEEGVSNEKEFEDQVWDKALTNDRQQAEKTLKATGMRITSIVAISPVNFTRIQQGVFGTWRSGRGGSHGKDRRITIQTGSRDLYPERSCHLFDLTREIESFGGRVLLSGAIPAVECGRDGLDHWVPEVGCRRVYRSFCVDEALRGQQDLRRRSQACV